MDEQRKYAILFAATIFAARKLNEIGSKPCPAFLERELLKREEVERRGKKKAKRRDRS